MLLNEITEESAIRLIRDDAWCLQEKHDGCRLVIRVIASEPGGPVLVLGFNKLGNATGISEAIRESAATIGESCVLDGEAVGDEFHVFDALERAGRDLRMSAYMLRLAQAAHLTKKAGPAVNLVETFLTTNSKDDAYHAATQRKAEGIVFKRNHSPWSAGRPNSGGDALKFKFVATASFIVEKVNTKRSVALSVVRGPDHVMVGNVAIPPNRDIPKPGEIVEVRYLYAFPSGSIFQPVYLGKRDDVEASECNISQLKYKAA